MLLHKRLITRFATLRKAWRSEAQHEPSTTEEATTAIPKSNTYTYRQEYVRCGKASCKCTNGQGHSPYWYAYWTEDHKTRKRYIGKTLKALPEPATPVGHSTSRQSGAPWVQLAHLPERPIIRPSSAAPAGLSAPAPAPARQDSSPQAGQRSAALDTPPG